MADSTQGGSKKTFAPAGAGFNLDQFKNEVANEIGISLGRQGSGLAAGAPGTSAQTDFEISSTLGQTSSFDSNSNNPAGRAARQSSRKK